MGNCKTKRHRADFYQRSYNTSVAVTPADVDACYHAMLDLLEGWNDSGKFQFDLSRIYSTGQSMALWNLSSLPRRPRITTPL